MANSQVTIAEALKLSSSLQAVSDSPRLDADVLLAHVLEKSRSYLYTWPERLLSVEDKRLFESLLERRKLGQPIAYLVGTREFWSLTLEVNAHTLIPRPETELLVETALQLIDKPNARVLDLGTGTGAIALALASERPSWEILAVDIVVEAVQLAEKNRRHLGFDNVTIIQSDWFEQVSDQVFDLIVANPPYIGCNDVHLAQGDVRFEPASALVAEADGLAGIKIIIGAASEYLSSGGWLVLEHGFQQGGAVRGLLDSVGYIQLSTQVDRGGQERVSVACRGQL